MNRQQLFIGNVCEVGSTTGQPIPSSTERPVARIDESRRETQNASIPIPRFYRSLPIVELPSRAGEIYPQNFMVEQQKTSVWELQFERFPKPSKFLCCKTSFKTEACSGSNYPSEVMRWINEFEMALQWTISRHCDRLLENIFQTSRRLMLRPFPP